MQTVGTQSANADAVAILMIIVVSPGEGTVEKFR